MAGISAPTSRAIPIIAPPPASPGPDRNKPNKKGEPPAQRQCRNVLIYGSCKNEGKTCPYYHPSPQEDPPPPPVTPPPSSPPKQPTSPPVTSSPSVNVNAAVFVPRGVFPRAFTPLATPAPTAPDDSASDAPLTDDSESNPLSTPFTAASFQPDQEEQTWDLSAQVPIQQLSIAPDPNASYTVENPGMYDSLVLDNGLYANPMMMAHDPYSYHVSSGYPRQPLNYHLYTTTLPYISNIPASQRLFMSDTLREDLHRRSEAIHGLSPAAGPLGLPEEIHSYHSLAPLEAPASTSDRRKFFGGWPSVVYKATNKTDGRPYILRRVEGFRMLHEAAFSTVDKWTKTRHPNVVSVVEAFTTRAFGDHSLVFVYDFHPSAQTLHQLHFQSQTSSKQPSAPTGSHGRYGGKHQHNAGSVHAHIPERTIWTYVVQIANAIKAVHDQGMAVRTIDPSKVLMTGKNRVRLNCCGILDVVGWNPAGHSVDALQQEDLVSFGKLVFTLCCNNLAAPNNLPKSMESISRHYSADLKNVALFLVSKPGPNKVIDILLDMFGTRLLTEMNAMQSYNDELESELMGELENARLVRLLCKFGFINERPEFNHEPRWSETGDRYIIKLFRDYVFHQVDDVGNPVVNMSHVLTCLNKLDVGTEERIMLVSRDEQSCLVVSYKEVKACIEQAYGELAKGVR